MVWKISISLTYHNLFPKHRGLSLIYGEILQISPRPDICVFRSYLQWKPVNCYYRHQLSYKNAKRGKSAEPTFPVITRKHNISKFGDGGDMLIILKTSRNCNVLEMSPPCLKTHAWNLDRFLQRSILYIVVGSCRFLYGNDNLIFLDDSRNKIADRCDWE